MVKRGKRRETEEGGLWGTIGWKDMVEANTAAGWDLLTTSYPGWARQAAELKEGAKAGARAWAVQPMTRPMMMFWRPSRSTRKLGIDGGTGLDGGQVDHEGT